MKQDMNLYRLKGSSRCQAGGPKLQPRYIIVEVRETGQVVCKRRKFGWYYTSHQQLQFPSQGVFSLH